ncbi:cytochrome P450 [Rhodococcus wratislaviensis]|uniref:cytochrome P450 n=1 Tax=Rhodococcus wratislaviensis TaxID=44752 RepID=UPI003656196D
MKPEVLQHISDLPVFTEMDDPAWGRDFYSTYDELFAKRPEGLARLETGEVVAFTNADVGALRTIPAVSHQLLDDFLAPLAAEVELDGLKQLFGPSTFVRRAAEHHPGKQLLSHVMSPRAVGGLRENLSAVIRDVLDTALSKDQVEFRTEVAVPILTGFWHDAIGLEPEETLEMMSYGELINPSMHLSPTKDEIILADRACADWMAALPGYLKRGAKTDKYPLLNDLLLQFASMGPDGRPDDPFMLLAPALLDAFVTLAAVQTVVAHTLLDAEVQPADYRGVRGFAGNAFMETLRLNNPVAMIGRETIEDIEYDGVHLPKGSTLIMLWLVSGRDPAAYSNPNDFVLERNRATQYSFGGGPYICGGRNVARIVGETLLAEMAEGKITLERTGEATVGGDQAGRDVVALPVRLARS